MAEGGGALSVMPSPSSRLENLTSMFACLSSCVGAFLSCS